MTHNSAYRQDMMVLEPSYCSGYLGAYREYFTRTAIAAQSWIAVLDLPPRTAIDRSPESRTAIQDYDEIAFAVLVAVLVAVLIAVLIAVFDF